MLTEEDDVEIHGLAGRGWSVSAIARHTGRDRKTVSKYLKGPKPSREPAPSCLEPFRAYLAARFADDAHVFASVLYRELVELCFDRSYPTFVRELRRLGLRPACQCCKAGSPKVTVGLEHEPGEELQLDWLELSETPWGESAHVLLGALSHSSQLRGVFTDGETFAHLAESLDGVLRRLGGTPRHWRTDRMATVVHPGTDRLRAEAAALAKHYGVQIAVCPANRPQRKRVVEAAARYVTQSWWRSAPVSTVAQAQADLDRWCVAIADRRRRCGGTVGELAACEPLLSLPQLPFPAEPEAQRVVARYALVSFEGNRYSVPPHHPGQAVVVRPRPGRGGPRTPRRAVPGDLLAGGAPDRKTPARAAGRRPDDPQRRARADARARGLGRVLNAQGLSAQAQPPAGRAGAGRDRQAAWRALGRRGRRPRRLRADREGGRGGEAWCHLPRAALAPGLPQALRDRRAAAGGARARREEQAELHPVPARPARRRGHRHRRAPPAGPPALRELPATDDARGVRLWGAALARPPDGRGARDTSLHRRAGQRAPDRAAGRWQEDARDRARPEGRARRLPRLLHDRRRPRRATSRAAIEGRWQTTTRFWNGPQLLVVDELGYLPLAGEAGSHLFQVISRRYEHGTIILTTNRGIADWGEIFEDSTVAAAILDRLLHHATVLQIDGESYRMRGHRARLQQLRAGLNQGGEFS